jgi:two-component system CheB/CheR fusion protein
MKNLLNSTGVATIFLDADLKLLRFTPAATQIFNFIETDVGRPLSDITTRLTMDNLATLARQVLDTLVPIKEDVQTRDGKWYSMRIHPYRTMENAIAGVGISFIDISEQERMRAALLFTKSILNTLRHPVVVMDRELKVVTANENFYETFKVKPEETEHKPIYELGNGQWNIPRLRKLLEEILPGNTEFKDYKVEQDFPLIGHRKMMLNARRLSDDKGSTQRILLAIEDVTDRKAPVSRQKEKYPGK